ncbi:hypothetical protein Acy02nite_48890 [Actinoplanes cyaneus]|uniref:Uncharacterized protein n=1 Tax=Actinoplanes cyaneus TaxID=52696 RepID=A0A919IKC2_9ACTN|nr:hypothetical protein [Actinoplanes cyaneus]GID67008.1 hypothetical protein Acy02nite_48890 [Actinoplanes cyaneus]
MILFDRGPSTNACSRGVTPMTVYRNIRTDPATRLTTTAAAIAPGGEAQ